MYNNMSDSVTKPAFSIVVPVFNVEKYLSQCLNSILSQSFKDFELICINDGSTDNSLEILRDFAQKDSRIKLISQANQGQGIARNIALDSACGKYLLFLDPDDFIEENTLKILYERFQQSETNVIQFNYSIVDGSGRFLETRSFSKNLKKKYKVSVTDSYNWQNIKLKNLADMSLPVWDKAYRLDFIKNNSIKFAPNKSAEDHIFSVSANLLADKILYVDKVFYNYRVRKGSAVNKTSDENFCIFENVELLRKFLDSNNLYERFELAFRNYSSSVLSWHYHNIPREMDSEYLSKVKNLLTPKDYKNFLEKCKGNFSLFEKIFSLKNQIKNGVKIKYVTLLGVTVPIKLTRKVMV